MDVRTKPSKRFRRSGLNVPIPTDRLESVSADSTNEDYKTLRNLLVISVVLTLLATLLAANRFFAVQVQRLAAEDYAVDSLQRSLLTEPIEVHFSVQYKGPARVLLKPIHGANAISIAEAIEAVGGNLRQRGITPVDFKVQLKSSFQNETIVASMWPADEFPWLVEQQQQQQQATAKQLEAMSPGHRENQPSPQRAERVLERCPEKWLPVEATIVLPPSDPKIGESVAVTERLRMEPRFWWRWMRFERVATDGATSGIVSSTNVQNLSVVTSRYARTLSAEENAFWTQLICEVEYPRLIAISWDVWPKESSSYIYTRQDKLIDPWFAGELEDAKKTLQQASVATAGDIRIGYHGASALIPFVAVLISAGISIQLRRLSQIGQDAVRLATWHPVRMSYVKLSAVDSKLMHWIERIVLSAFLVFALWSLPIAPIIMMAMVWYPAYATETAIGSSFFVSSVVLGSPAGWLFVPLTIASVHQSTMIFGLKFLTPRPVT